jgi:hypothetical protein
MRPLSLAAIFAAIHGAALGVVNAFVYVANRPDLTFTTRRSLSASRKL